MYHLNATLVEQVLRNGLRFFAKTLILVSVGLATTSCAGSFGPPTPVPPIVITVVPPLPPTVVVITSIPPPPPTVIVATAIPPPPARLHAVYLGQDGSKLIGSGCPGTDYKGQLLDFRIHLSGVDTTKSVRKITVQGAGRSYGDLTWEYPCAATWALLAIDRGLGEWDLYMAPSESTSSYMVTIQFNDGSVASATTFVPATLPVLRAVYLGQDGARLIGSGCPGTDYKGQIVDFHIRLSGVDTTKSVRKISVRNPSGTDGWDVPCTYPGWAIHAIDRGTGEWDLYMAPSQNNVAYEITIQYGDGSVATATVFVR